MSLAIDMCVKPRMGLLYFDDYKELNEWIMHNKDSIMKNGGTYNRTTNIITFPNGNRLMLGYGELNKFIGCEFFFVLGTVGLKDRIRI